MELRPASPSDLSTAVGWIHSTAPGFMDFLFGFDDHQRALKALGSFYLDPKSRFSFMRATICEVDGNAAGLLLSFPGEWATRLDFGMAPLLLKEYGLRDGLRFLANALQIPSFKETEAGEFYIAHVATSPLFRRRGVGYALLEDAAQRAREDGRAACSLMVDIDNPGAIALYQKCGFEIVETLLTARMEKKMGSRGHHRMRKKLL